MATTNHPVLPPTAEVAFRGTIKTFRFKFTDAAGVAISAHDPSNYPQVSITLPNGAIALTAGPPAVVAGSDPGTWQYDYSVPVNAEITATGSTPWYITAEIYASSGRHEKVSLAFVVRDPAVLKSTNERRFYPGIEGNGMTIVYRSIVPLHDIRLSVLATGTTNYLLQDATEGTGTGDIRRVQSGDGIYMYMYSLPALTTDGVSAFDLCSGSFQAHWTVTESADLPPEYVYQVMRVYPNLILEFIPDLSYFVDKIQKNWNTIWAYKTEDLADALVNGLRLINSTTPATAYSFTSLNSALRPFMTMAAAWWILNGQFSVAVDTQFSFQGLRTTLDQDQTSGIDSALSRAYEMITSQLREIKTDIVMQESPVGVVMTRPSISRTGIYNNRAYRLSSGTDGPGMGFLADIGLFSVTN